tara:strand:- start:656 stop:1276 length:621 start_codon:yes stop_codon:yes gene_type:complete
MSCLNYKKNTFNIQQLTRLNEDSCYKTNRTSEARKPGEYSVRNFHDCDCGAPATTDLSLQQPATFLKDGHGWVSNKGCAVDNDSLLRNSRNLTNMKEINQLFTRFELTTPYMGRGSNDGCVESILRPGECTVQQKSCNNLSGVTIDRFTPQLSCVRENIQNPNNIIQENNDDGWVRGGQPSRQIIRNKDYLTKCGFNYNGKYWSRN